MDKRWAILAGLFGLLIATGSAIAQQSDKARPLIPPTYLAPRFEAPPDAPSSIVIAAKDEPGERLIVTGRVLDGTRPVAGVSIYVCTSGREWPVLERESGH